MARYIDADAIKWHEVEWAYGKRNDKIIACEIAVDETPTADIRPVVHAHWKDERFNRLLELHVAVCSNCNLVAVMGMFCMHCGAIMDGGVGSDETQRTGL